MMSFLLVFVASQLLEPTNAFLLSKAAPFAATTTTSTTRSRQVESTPLLLLRTKLENLDNHDDDDVDEDDNDDLPFPSSLEQQAIVPNENSTTSALQSPLPLVSVLDDNLIHKALVSNVSYFYLQRELGLSEESMWKITNEAPSALGMTATTIRCKVEVLRDAMDLSLDDIRDILSRQPTLLHLSAQNNLKPKLEWIKNSLEMTTQDQLRRLVMAQPSILTYSPTNLRNKFRFFTHKTKGLGFSVEETRQLLLQEPKLCTASVKTGLLPRARFFLQELEIPKDKLRTILTKNPRLLLYSLETNLTPKLINYCIMTLHMEPTIHVLKLLMTYPQILDNNFERKILPITRYFMMELQFSAHEFRTILLKCPRLTTNSIQKIKHNVGYLRYGLQLDAAGVRRVLYQAPQVLSLDEKTNLAPKIEFLKQQLLGTSSTTTNITKHKKQQQQQQQEEDDDEVSRQVIKSCILGLPTILYLSVEKNLAPKIEYLRSMLQLEVRTSFSSSSSSPQEQPQQQQQQQGTKAGEEEEESLQRLLCQTILKKPALLGYSLEKRVRPRMERIVNAGLPPSSITIGISMTDEKFQSWLHGRQKKKAKMAIVWQQSSSSSSSLQPTLSSSSSSLSSGTTNLEAEEDPQLKKSTKETDRSGRIVHWTRERKPV